jgi:hypothetical protein
MEKDLDPTETSLRKGFEQVVHKIKNLRFPMSCCSTVELQYYCWKHCQPLSK